MADFPVVLTTSGAVPTAPAVIRATIEAQVASTNPGYTVNLPGSLIEDVLSTQIAGIAEIDSARVELLNSMTPYGANDFVLSELGQIYIGPGSAPGTPTNTSVFVRFFAEDTLTSVPLPGQVIPRGFTVGDGTYQYVVQDDGLTDDSGFVTLYCISPTAGIWTVAAGTVTNIVTQQPAGVTISCSNPSTGIVAQAAETFEAYRARVLQAGQAISTGTMSLLKTALGNVAGVQQRLISVRQQGQFWEVIVGGGDPYEVAGAIFDSGLNIAGLTGSVLSVTAITQAVDGKVTTDLNHGYSDGQVVVMSGIVGMTPLNGVPVTITVVNEKQFTIGEDTRFFPGYVSGGVCSPNLRNVTVDINDVPDVYAVAFVSPPTQTVTVAVTWNTTSPNFTSQAAVAQLSSAAIAAYINGITVGAPISLLALEAAFAVSVLPVLDVGTVSVLDFAVSINGIPTSPTGQLVFGDPESYFTTTQASISVSQS